jgi:hypothetical protein
LRNAVSYENLGKGNKLKGGVMNLTSTTAFPKSLIEEDVYP